MKICFFTENYYKGGLDTFLINLFNYWPEKKDRLTLLCNSTHPGLSTIKTKVKRPFGIIKYSRFFSNKFVKGTNVGFIRKLFIVRVFFIILQRLFQYPLLFPWYVCSLTFYFWRSDFDRLMVVNGGYPASLLCRCAGIAWYLSGKQKKAIFNFHSGAMRVRWYAFIPEYLIDKAVKHTSTYIISVSDDCLDSLKVRLAFSGCRKLIRIYNGIEDPLLNIEKHKLIEVNREKSFPPSCLMLATYQASKGHDFLLEAFSIVLKTVPEAQLLIYGYGKQREYQRVADKVKKLSLDQHVQLNKFITEIDEVILSSSLLVVPSQQYESFGLSIIEAMALGVPAITTDVGGIPEVLAGTNAGYVCSKSDVLAFAKVISKILVNPLHAAELGHNARLAFEQRYTATMMAKQYHSFILKS